ncbi:hypothetical protein HQN64_23505 [Enterobacteriaceae bacterium BIT-l23]|uniref:hypothetical protein n=1 Tax=Jejubacter sp. L23 TaxID=3092086 RepID=UPI001585A09B|nr:hypothetical protein [Enterobacteriaceae bacterium BIT-l23]
MINIASDGSIYLMESIRLNSDVTKIELIPTEKDWEEWIKNELGEIVSYRRIIFDKKETFGKLYLIVTFTSPVNDKSLLCSWFLAPEKLIDGKQSKPEGKVTKALQQWFFERTGQAIPYGNEREHIDAAYDHWNCVGGIVCNYRTSFKTQNEWNEYKKNNKF